MSIYKNDNSKPDIASIRYQEATRADLIKMVEKKEKIIMELVEQISFLLNSVPMSPTMYKRLNEVRTNG